MSKITAWLAVQTYASQNTDNNFVYFLFSRPDPRSAAVVSMNENGHVVMPPQQQQQQQQQEQQQQQPQESAAASTPAPEATGVNEVTIPSGGQEGNNGFAEDNQSPKVIKLIN